eukprot:TRINITY_DN1626_c0_g3_i1.p2 TRINITY_DN1626_c0_g3~~TRINITY_DN1626_c0_g3_i1.p2  ORF type:complete len:292 (+),score=128.26 TRINITY_DN1626_c0_g3_i1:46-876(+)
MALMMGSHNDLLDNVNFKVDLRQNQPRGLETDEENLANIKLPVCPLPSSIPNLKLNKGTTTLGFQYKGGVIIAVDSRASTGQYIASGTVQKVLEINEYLLGTMAGGAADCQFWQRVLGRECRLWELRNKQRISIAAASKILANITYSYRNHGLSMGTMVAGWDKSGPSLYMVDDKGTRMKGELFSVGSGSIYAYGVLDAEYKNDMTDEEAINLGRRAILHATHRDAGSGGYIQVYHIHAPNAKGESWTKVSRDDCMDLMYKAWEDKTMAKCGPHDP